MSSYDPTMAKSEKSFAFVMVEDGGRPNLGDRRLVRSHSMLGKNRRKVAEQPASHWLAHYDSTSQAPRPLLLSFRVSQESPLPRKPKGEKAAPMTQRSGAVISNSYKHGEEGGFVVDNPPAPALSLLLFADDLDTQSLALFSCLSPLTISLQTDMPNSTNVPVEQCCQDGRGHFPSRSWVCPVACNSHSSMIGSSLTLPSCMPALPFLPLFRTSSCSAGHPRRHPCTSENLPLD